MNYQAYSTPEARCRHQGGSVGEKLARGKGTADTSPRDSEGSPPHTPLATYHHLVLHTELSTTLAVGDSISHSFLSDCVPPPCPPQASSQGDTPGKRTPPGD